MTRLTAPVFVALMLCGAGIAQVPAVAVVEDGESIRVLDGDRLLFAYRATGHPWKAHAEQLCTPGGTNVLQVAPPDHVHHRGLVFALGADEVDYWGEHYVERPGRQRGEPITSVTIRATEDERAASFSHRVDWVAKDDRDAGEPEQAHVREQREIRVEPLRDSTRVTWRTVLTVPDDHAPVRLWGRPYFGLELRFVAEMDGDGHFFCVDDSPGEVVRGDERLQRSTWCAYTADAGKGEVTVAMFDHPDNLRHPATWFSMAKPFAFLAATLDLAGEPIELGADAPLRLCYGIAVFDGAVAPERVEQDYQAWLVTCSRTGDDGK